MVAAAALLSLSALMAWHLADSAIERQARYSAVGAVNTPSSLGALLTGNVGGEPGDMVFLNNVRLFAGPKPTLCIVSGAEGLQMLVVLEAPDLVAGHLPMTVDIKGLIRRLPSLAVLRKQWNLSKDQIQTFEKQRIYIAAERVWLQNEDAATD
ncbi:MAG: hypothetical protein ACRD20_08260 [Terriglobales bacterium]